MLLVVGVVETGPPRFLASVLGRTKLGSLRLGDVRGLVMEVCPGSRCALVGCPTPPGDRTVGDAMNDRPADAGMDETVPLPGRTNEGWEPFAGEPSRGERVTNERPACGAVRVIVDRVIGARVVKVGERDDIERDTRVGVVRVALVADLVRPTF